jgi:integrase/recombinase XerD
MSPVKVPAVEVPVVPVITIFVRHSADCTHKDDETYKRCRCSKHLRWSYGGRQFRKSAKTRTWETADEVRRKVAESFVQAGPEKPIQDVVIVAKGRADIPQAVALFVSSKRSQGLDDRVLKKYERELGRFGEFLSRRGRIFPHDISLEDLTEFRADWSEQYPSSTTRAKVQERLRGFLRYCYQARMIDRVPELSAIKVDEPPTLPLTDKQYAMLLEAVPTEFPPPKGTRVHALIRLMRYSGLAIRDAVTLERGELRKGKGGVHRVVTDRTKTGTHVSVPIPPEVAEEVLGAMRLNGSLKYVFWHTGTGKPQTAVTNWQHDLRQVFRAAGQPDGHPHQLRDTFAVGLLEKGVPLEEVSKALGHKSTKTTEKSYGPWVQARQDRLDAQVMATWLC